jgi:hypothetical protein
LLSDSLFSGKPGIDDCLLELILLLGLVHNSEVL